jgi:hypothetical protein
VIKDGILFKTPIDGLRAGRNTGHHNGIGRFGRSDGSVVKRSGQVWSPNVRCRHHTDLKGLKGIKNDQAIKASRGKPAGVDVEVAPFATARSLPERSSPTAQTGSAGGGAYVEFDLPEGSIPTSPMVGPRNTARIPTETSLSLEGLNPRFVTVPWWKFWE